MKVTKRKSRAKKRYIISFYFFKDKLNIEDTLDSLLLLVKVAEHFSLQNIIQSYQQEQSAQRLRGKQLV
jgi:ABC-type multidrug transport system permease subunit